MYSIRKSTIIKKKIYVNYKISIYIIFILNNKFKCNLHNRNRFYFNKYILFVYLYINYVNNKLR